MPEADIEIAMGPIRVPSFRHHLIDFANMLKAFIGANYLTIAFSFRQSGIALGIAGLVIVATLTAHCCHLLAKCKYHAIRNILQKQNTSIQHKVNHQPQCHVMASTFEDRRDNDEGDDVSENDDEETIKRLEQNMNYGDIGRLCFGTTGTTLVNAAVMITQFGFCIGYYIFLGNTLQSMFPLYNCSSVVNNATFLGEVQHYLDVKQINSLSLEAVPVEMADMQYVMPSKLRSKRAQNTLNESLLGWKKGSAVWTTKRSRDNLTAFLKPDTDSVEILKATTNILSKQTNSSIKLSGLTETYSSAQSEMSFSAERNSTHNRITDQSRNLQSATSSSSSVLNPVYSSNYVFTPQYSPMLAAITDFATTAESWTNITVWSLSRGKHVPNLKLLVMMPAVVFIAMTLIRSLRQMGFISFIANASIMIGCVEVFIFLISGFEVSSSYVWANWKDMPIFFGMVTGAYEGIGTILPIEASMEGNRHNFVKFLYGAVAMLTVVLAFFGIVGYLRFGQDIEQMINANIPNGQWLSIAVNSCLCLGVLLTFPLMMYPVTELAELYLFGNGRLCGPKVEVDKSCEHKSLMPKKVNDTLLVAEKVSERVPTWRRNCLRIFIVLSAGGLAVLLRNNFAYISAFVGALGSTVLAYILPCLFHLRLCWTDLPTPIIAKDITIIVMGIGCGVAGVYSVLDQIIRNDK